MPWPWRRTPKPKKTFEERQWEHIERVAYELYQNRCLLNRAGNAQSDWETAIKIVQSGWHTTLFASHRPLIQLEKKVWEPILAWANNQAWLSFLGLIGNVGLIIGVITYIGSEKQRRDAEVLNAWQTLTSAHGQSGSGGRIQALEFLNASPGANWRRKFPWFCAPLPLCTWPSESLAGINLSVEPGDMIGVDRGRASTAKIRDRAAIEQESSSTNEPQPSEVPERVYLVRIQLPEATLENANLQNANLRNANLQNANLGEANLQNAILWEANLQDTYLWKVNLQNVVLWNVNLQDADATRARLRGARLENVNLQDAALIRSNLQDTELIRSNLRGADLAEVNLQGAFLRQVNLQGADLRSANLQGAFLEQVNLQGADLGDPSNSNIFRREANLQGTIFLSTDLRNTVNLRKQALEGSNPPLICNSPLPENIEIKDGKDRDCDQMSSVLIKRYPSNFGSLENAEALVKEIRKKTWD